MSWISFDTTWLHPKSPPPPPPKKKKTVFLFIPSLVSLYLFEQCLRLGFTSTSSVCCLFKMNRFMYCKSLWIKMTKCKCQKNILCIQIHKQQQDRESKIKDGLRTSVREKPPWKDKRTGWEKWGHWSSTERGIEKKEKKRERYMTQRSTHTVRGYGWSSVGGWWAHANGFYPTERYWILGNPSVTWRPHQRIIRGRRRWRRVEGARAEGRRADDR